MREIIARIDKPMALQSFLRRTFPALPTAILRKAMDNRDVRRAGKRLYADELIYPDDALTLYIDDRYLDGDEPLDVVFADKNIVIINKKPGITVVEERQGTPCLQDAVRKLYPEACACHRLDYNTGGLVVFSRTNAAKQQLEAAFRDRTVRKFYRCLVWGQPKEGAGHFRAYLKKDAQAAKVTIYDWAAPGAQPIETAYAMLDSCLEYSLLEVELITGRTHQIRAHLAHLGYPICGDDRYGNREKNKQWKVTKQQLWATRIEFSFPRGTALAYLDKRKFSVSPKFTLHA